MVIKFNGNQIMVIGVAVDQFIHHHDGLKKMGVYDDHLLMVRSGD